MHQRMQRLVPCELNHEETEFKLAMSSQEAEQNPTGLTLPLVGEGRKTSL